MRWYFLFASLFFVSASLAAGENCFDLFKTASPQHIDAPRLLLTQRIEAAENVKKYFTAIDEILVERTDILNLLQVALIAEEHVLLMGPPGNAKSMIADIVLGNIVDGKTGLKSYYRIQMTPETTMSETHGPINPKEIFDSGKIKREYDQGMLFSRGVFIDEIFDARANAQRNLLGLLAERQHAQGTDIVPGQIETAIAATNRYLDEVYEKSGDQGPKALLDRFSFNIYVPGEFEFADSYSRLISSAKIEKKPLPRLTFEDLEQLRGLVREVELPKEVEQFLSLLSFRMKSQTEAMEQAELKAYRKKIQQGDAPPPPYRSTKYHSPRTLFKAAGILKAFVVNEWVRSGGSRPLRATIEDIKNLKAFFVLNGPNRRFTESMMERTANPYERSQLSTILEESKIFDETLDAITAEINKEIYQYALEEMEEKVSAVQEESAKQRLVLELVEKWIRSREMSAVDLQENVTGVEIGHGIVARFLEAKIKQLAPDSFEKTIQQKILEIEAAKKLAIAQEKERVEAQRREAERLAREEQNRREQEEVDKKVDEMLKNMMGDSLKKFPEGFSEVASIKENGDGLYVKLGNDVYVLLSGEKGYRLSSDGKIQEINYGDIQDSVLKSVLMEASSNKVVGLDESTIFIDNGIIAQVVKVPEFTVIKNFFLKTPNYVLVDKNKNYFYQFLFSENKVIRTEIRTGTATEYQVAFKNQVSSHYKAGMDLVVQLEGAEGSFVITANVGQYLVNLELGTGIKQLRHANPQISSSGTQAVQTDFSGNIYYIHQDGQAFTIERLNKNESEAGEVKEIQAPEFAGEGTKVTIFDNNRYAGFFNPSKGFALYDFAEGKFVVTEAFKNILSLSWIDSTTLLLKVVDVGGKMSHKIMKLDVPDRKKLEKEVRSQNESR